MPLASLVLILAAPQARDLAADCDALLARYARAGWSGSVLVARDGKPLLARGYGQADAGSGRDNDEHTLFEIASLAKQFTAAAILKLAQQGKLELDDPIAEHLPGVPAHSKGITIHHLITHTSGVPRSNTAGGGEDLAAAVPTYLGEGPLAKPGQRFEYWNGGYALLAGIVERASGISFTEYCERELFAPASMRDTGFTGDTDLDPQRAAVGHDQRGAPRSALEHPYGAFGYQYRGMGGVVTTVLDLHRWDRALAGADVLNTAARKQLFTPAKEGYACGWWVTKAERGGERHSHGGDVRGFHCDFRRFPDSGACIAVLANTDAFPAWEIGENLECALFGRSFRYPVPESVALSAEELAALAGTYTAKAGRMIVRADGGSLLAGVEGQELISALLPSRPAGWSPDLEELSATAIQIVESIARGDVELLRKKMADPGWGRWPDDVRDSIYPEYEKQHGRLKQVTALGAVPEGGRVEIVLQLEHEVSPGRVRIAFSQAGLEILDWNGPEFPATLRLLPQGGTRFLTAATATGAQPRAFEFLRKGQRITGVKTQGLELKRAQ